VSYVAAISYLLILKHKLVLHLAKLVSAVQKLLKAMGDRHFFKIFFELIKIDVISSLVDHNS
jgi:hypothetical protein